MLLLSPSPSRAPLTPIEWFSLLHPVLMIPVCSIRGGGPIRLGIWRGERRLEINPCPPAFGGEHCRPRPLGWLGAVVARCWIALIHFVLSAPPSQLPSAFPAWRCCCWSVPAPSRVCWALWRVRLAALRGGQLRFAFTSAACWRWAASPRVLGARPTTRSRGLLEFPLLGKRHVADGPVRFRWPVPEIFIASLRFRPLQCGAPTCWWPLLLAVQAITGSRDFAGACLEPAGIGSGQHQTPPHPFQTRLPAAGAKAPRPGSAPIKLTGGSDARASKAPGRSRPEMFAGRFSRPLSPLASTGPVSCLGRQLQSRWPWGHRLAPAGRVGPHRSALPAMGRHRGLPRPTITPSAPVIARQAKRPLRTGHIGGWADHRNAQARFTRRSRPQKVGLAG